MDLDDLPPLDQPLARLKRYQTARTLEEEQRMVELLMEKRERGESLSAREERMVAYSIFGTASRCGY